MKVNLFIAGAMKAGTTSFYSLLEQHPEIEMAREKEPCYFTEPGVLEKLWPEMWAKGYWKDPEAYHQLFKSDPNTRYWGESSTSYTKLPISTGTALAIHRYNPDARIVYLMRDPFQRAVSHYMHNLRMGYEQACFPAAARPGSEYFSVSDYPYQMAEFFDVFPRQSFYFIIFERLQANMPEELQSFYRWLGVNHTVIPTTMQHLNRGTHEVHMTPDPLRRILQSSVYRQFRQFIPARLRQRAKAQIVKPFPPSQLREKKEVYKQNRAYFERIKEQTEEMIGEKVPWLSH